MSFTPLAWVNGKPPALNAVNLNRLEQGVADVHREMAGLPYRSRGAVCFTWDDGYTAWETIAAEAERLGQRHTFAVCVNRVGIDGFTDAHIIRLHSGGHEIAAHSMTHAKMTTISSAERVAEYEGSRAYLENLVGAGEVTTWAYPYGTSSTPPGRDQTTDAELYLRFDRLLDTTGTDAYGVFPAGQRLPFLTPRMSWDPNNLAHHRHVVEWIRKAATHPILVMIYGHNASGDGMARALEAMRLAATLGVPAIRADEALPGGPVSLLRDPGFEDPDLGAWRATAPTGTVAESAVDEPMVGMPGARSLHLASTDVSLNSWVEQYAPVLYPGQEYTLSYRVRTNRVSFGMTPRIYARLRFYGKAGQLSNHESGNYSNATWQRWAQVVATAPAAATHVAVAFIQQQTEGDSWWDHVHLGPTADGVLG